VDREPVNNPDLIALNTPADEPPDAQSPPASDGAPGHALQRGDNPSAPLRAGSAATHAGSVKKAAHARSVKEMPPVLAGHFTSALQARAKSFYRGVAEMFER